MKTEEKQLFEIFEEVNNASTQVDRMEILKKHEGFSLFTILQLAFDENIELDFPSGAPPFKKNPAPVGLQYTRLNRALKPLGQCIKGNKIPVAKKERIFINILEQVHPKDAEIIVAAKDKKLAKLYTKITDKLIGKAYPTLVKAKK